MNAKEIREAREILQQAMKRADQASKRIKETLRDSEQRMAPIRAELKRAGYLR
jgi:prefoldin subunit 5